MPHKCVRCGKVFANNSAELVKGCPCGSRVFLFLREDQVTLKELVESGMREGEAEKKAPDAPKAPVDVSHLHWLEEELAFLSKDKPVSVELDAVENLKILEPGSYELDISSLMKGNPLVIKSEHDIYYIKLPSLKRK